MHTLIVTFELGIPAFHQERLVQKLRGYVLTYVQEKRARQKAFGAT